MTPKKFNGKILAADQCNFYIFDGNKLKKYSHNGDLQCSSNVKISKLDNVNLYPKILSRFFRRGILGGCLGEKTLFIWSRREIFLIDKKTLCIIRQECLPSGRYLLNSCCVQIDGSDNFFYGDYFSNPNKLKCCIWKFNNNGLSKMCEFSEGEINHIHSVLLIDERNLIILAGDFGDAASIWNYSLLSNKLIKIAGGQQKYRSCVGFICDDFLYYASDTTSELNGFYKLNIYNKCVSLVHSNPASVIYGDYDWSRKILCYATNLEASLSSKNKWSKWFSKELPPCFETNIIKVYMYFNDERTCIFEAYPSKLPYRLFQYPTCLVRTGGGYAYITGMSVKEIHNKTLQIPIDIGLLT